MIWELISRRHMRLLALAKVWICKKQSITWMTSLHIKQLFHSEDSPVVQVDMPFANNSSITTVDSQKSQSSTLGLFSWTLNPTLRPRVLMLRNAELATSLPKELLTEEEELTEPTVESHHIFPPTPIVSSTPQNKPTESRELTKPKLDTPRSNSPGKDLLLVSEEDAL